MRAVDTNVLLRILTGDDARQCEIAESYIENGAWVSILVLTETIWTFSSYYKETSEGVAQAIEMLLKHDRLVLQDADVVEAALNLFHFKPSLRFSDCLIVEIARKAGHLPLGTFDRRLARVPGAVRL